MNTAPAKKAAITSAINTCLERGYTYDDWYNKFSAQVDKWDQSLTDLIVTVPRGLGKKYLMNVWDADQIGIPSRLPPPDFRSYPDVYSQKYDYVDLYSNKLVDVFCPDDKGPPPPPVAVHEPNSGRQPARTTGPKKILRYSSILNPTLPVLGHPDFDKQVATMLKGVTVYSDTDAEIDWTLMGKIYGNSALALVGAAAVITTGGAAAAAVELGKQGARRALEAAILGFAVSGCSFHHTSGSAVFEQKGYSESTTYDQNKQDKYHNIQLTKKISGPCSLDSEAQNYVAQKFEKLCFMFGRYQGNPNIISIEPAIARCDESGHFLSAITYTCVTERQRELYP